MTVYTIAIIDSEGSCSSMYTSSGIPEDEGPWSSDPTKTVVHITNEISDFTNFMNINYYKSGEWLSRAGRPGPYYNWVDESWVLDSEQLMVEIRQERNMLLYKSDWTQLPDSPLPEDSKGEWALYRSGLRDVPGLNSGALNINEVVWPDEPN